MNYQEILLSAKLLSSSDQSRLISELLGLFQEDYLSYRRQQFFDKQGYCPHCEGKKYYKYGTDKGCQRFKCKVCKRTFTEFTGTWIDGLQKKNLVKEYLELMIAGKSLDKISSILEINKKTAFDWRHKILSSLSQNRGSEMVGIVESDETFFEESQKGTKNINREGRKRGLSTAPGKKRKRGVSDTKAAVITTADRQGGMNLSFATMGRISKEDISRSMSDALSDTVFLCTDGHVSYKGFALDNNLNHIVLRADLKQHVKLGVYHIQNVNSIHNRLKKWINSSFWGVSTKYLQNYLGWFRLNEKLKDSTAFLKEFFFNTMWDTDTLKRYGNIDVNYQLILQRSN